jgi:hypothetical protein
MTILECVPALVDRNPPGRDRGLRASAEEIDEEVGADPP